MQKTFRYVAHSGKYSARLQPMVNADNEWEKACLVQYIPDLDPDCPCHALHFWGARYDAKASSDTEEPWSLRTWALVFFRDAREEILNPNFKPDEADADLVLELPPGTADQIKVGEDYLVTEYDFESYHVYSSCSCTPPGPKEATIAFVAEATYKTPEIQGTIAGFWYIDDVMFT